MAIESIAPAAFSIEGIVNGVETRPEAPGGFGARLETELAEVNRQILDSEANVRELAAGGDVALHDVMLSLEQAKLSFELVLAVRNKALEAYQELMRMQM